VETRNRLDPVRFGPDNLARDPEMDPLFHSINRNKLGILLDLKTTEGVELIKRLVRISDVVVDNFSPGVMRRFALAYDDLKKIKPNIITISFPGVGSEGPLADVVTYGPSLAGLAGLDSLIGYEGERVLGMQQAYADINAALFGAFAIQMALYHRERYGEGQHIEVAQIEALLSTMPEPIVKASLDESVLGTLGNTHPLMAVHNNYPCKGDDKWVSIAIWTEAEWKGFCKALGDPGWTKMEKFADNFKRWLNRKELDGRIAEWTVGKTAQEVMETLQGAGVAAVPCADTEDRYFDPHFQEREIIVNIEHPVTGVDFVPKVVCNLSETPGEIRRPAPLLGEHNNYVYGELLGLSGDEIAELVQKKVIF